VLGEQGATVYVTARTVKPGGHALPGSLEETVAEIGRRGGKAIGVALDMLDDVAIAALFAQVKAEQGRLDILVNNAMAIPQEMTERKPFWEKSLANWEVMDTGVRAAYVAATHGARIMTVQGSGLIVALSGYVGRTYTYDVIFGTTKSATDRMACDMAVELKPFGVASVSLWQGFTTTERALENLKNIPGMAAQLNAAAGSSPEFPGRIIAALAADPAVLAMSGGTYITAELAAGYGVTDVDGRKINSLRAERGAPIFGPV
ncbi:MAG: hypothetical protein RL367_2748, partial [Pseudomonadota bacterium]